VIVVPLHVSKSSLVLKKIRAQAATEVPLTTGVLQNEVGFGEDHPKEEPLIRLVVLQ
jgi:hypothetical protein